MKCQSCGTDTGGQQHYCIRCDRKRDKLQAAAGDIRSGRRSMRDAVSLYGVTSCEVVAFMAERR